MRLLHYQFGEQGGSERFFVQLVQAFNTRGVEQKVVIAPNRPWRDQLPDSVQVFAESRYRTLSLDRLRLPRRLDRLHDQWCPDAMLGWMHRGARILPTSGHVGRRFARLGDLVANLHDYRAVDCLICNSPCVAERARELGWRRQQRVISNFTHSVPIVPIPRSELETPLDVPLICAVGRLVEGKGFDLILHALKRLPSAYLWIIGDGKQLKKLQGIAHSLDILDRVRFTGWQSDPVRYLAAADLLAFASKREALGNVVLEAWSQRIPIVSTRSEGPNWLIDHGVNGHLVDIGDERQFAEAISYLLEHPDKRRAMARAGYEKLTNEFSQQAIVDQYMELLF